MITEVGANSETLFFEFDSEENAASFASQERFPSGAIKSGFDPPGLDGKRVYFTLSPGKFVRISMGSGG